jgi:excisionase family DNA binding protein
MTQLYSFPSPFSFLEPAAPIVVATSSPVVAPVPPDESVDDENVHVDVDPLLAGEMLTVADVAERLNISTTTVHSLIERGSLRAFYFCSRPRIAESDLRAFMISCRT